MARLLAALLDDPNKDFRWMWRHNMPFVLLQTPMQFVRGSVRVDDLVAALACSSRDAMRALRFGIQWERTTSLEGWMSLVTSCRLMKAFQSVPMPARTSKTHTRYAGP